MQPTQILGNRYVLMETCGQGGMATVFRAMDVQDNRIVAIKQLRLPAHLSQQEQETLKWRFRNEAHILALLQHPYIVGFEGIFEHEGLPFMVLEYIEGTSLEHFSAVLHQQPAQLLPLFDQLAEALEYLHSRGIVHLDIKPENILVLNRSQIKLLDFGIARMQGLPAPSPSSAFTGTLAYLSPEQLQDERLTHSPSDIYAFGVLMYQCLTGHLPHQADNPGMAMLMVMNQDPIPPIQHNPLIGEDLNQLILICLHKQAQHRFSSCRPLRMLFRVLLQRVFSPTLHAQMHTPAILPKIRMFKHFGLQDIVGTLLESQSTGQCLIWTAYEEGCVWIAQEHITGIDLKNKQGTSLQLLSELMCWESGNFLYIPHVMSPLGESHQGLPLLREVQSYYLQYRELWEQYQEHDLPEQILTPTQKDLLSECARTVWESIDGQHPIAYLMQFLPYARLELLKALKNLEDRQFIFVERIRS